MRNSPITARRWYRQQLLLPLLFGIVVLTVINQFNLDIVFAKWLFSLEGDQDWTLRHNPFFEHVLHNGGRHVITFMALVLLLSALLSSFVPKLRQYRRSLLMLILSVASTILLVRYGKAITNVSCPWDVALFGGDKPFVAFPATLMSQQVLGQCYPGGHSSGAFAWVALYYAAKVHFPQWRKPLLRFAIGLGALFALTQELRGAHFLSHDLTSLWLAWLIATASYGLIYRPWQTAGRTAMLSGVSPSLRLAPVKPQA